MPQTAKQPQALVIFLHGFAEHVERYDHVWPLFARNGIEVFGYDQRGAGESGPAHSDTTLRQQMEDLDRMVCRERQRLREAGHKDVPLFLYSHSMVGSIGH